MDTCTSEEHMADDSAKIQETTRIKELSNDEIEGIYKKKEVTWNKVQKMAKNKKESAKFVHRKQKYILDNK